MKEQPPLLTRRRSAMKATGGRALWSVSFCNCKLAEFIVVLSRAGIGAGALFNRPYRGRPPLQQLLQLLLLLSLVALSIIIIITLHL